jgi:hypothetical protein
MAGRPGPALFELIKDKTGTAGTSQQQASAIPVMPPRPRAPEPSAAPVPPPAVPSPPPAVSSPPPAPPPAAASEDSMPRERPKAWVTEREGSPIDLGRPITISPSALWWAVAGVVVWTFLIWGVAWTVSARREAERANRQFAAAGIVRDPLKSGSEPIPVNPTLISNSPKPPPPRPTGASESARPAPAAAPPAAPTGTGDARVPGLNYLMLASRLDRETADRMVSFLGQNGVRAVAVAKGSGGANNPGPYTVYALDGITREMYRARSPERTDLEDKVRRLGKTWQKDHKGGTDFATATWEKYGS